MTTGAGPIRNIALLLCGPVCAAEAPRGRGFVCAIRGGASRVRHAERQAPGRSSGRSAARAPSARPRSTRRCGRSVSPCSRPTSTSRWSSSSWSGCASGPPGQDVLKSLTPDQAVLRIVRDEMVALLGGDEPPRHRHRLPAALGRPHDRAAGLGQDHHHAPSSASGWERRATIRCSSPPTSSGPPRASSSDAWASRPACKVHHPEGTNEPQELLRSALEEARAVGHDFVLVDTAGRLHVDDELMAELSELKALAEPSEVLYVADAMTGQDAVKSAEEFHQRVGHHGDRAHQARRRRARRGRPLRGRGHGLPGEVRGPRREGGRVRALPPRRAWSAASSAWATCSGSSSRPRRRWTASRRRRSSGSCARASSPSRTTATSWRQMRKMGPLEEVLAMIPGLGAALKGVDVEQGEREMRRAVAIIDSMTPRERRDPGADQRQPPQADRQGQRHHGGGREPPAEAVRAGAQGHEERWAGGGRRR